MLTREYILKVARLLDQTGEPRPGFLHDEKPNLEGQGSAVESPALEERSAAKTKKRGKKGIRIKLTLDYEEDPKSGDVRIVQR